MNLFALSGLLTGVLSLPVAVLVFLKQRRTFLNKIWILFVLSVSVWGFGCYMMASATDKKTAFLWYRIAHIGVILIPITIYHFIDLFLKLSNKIRLKLIYIVGITFFLANILDLAKSFFYPDAKNYLIIAHMKWIFDSFYMDTPPGPMYTFFVFFFIVVVSIVFYELFKASKHATGSEKNQIQYFILATLVGFTGGGSSFLPVFGINVYPIGNFAIVISPIIITYAILRHRLLDIEVIIRETAVYAGIFGFSVGIFVLAMIAGEQALEPYLGGRQWIVPALALFIVTIAVRPIERLVYNTVGKILFRKKHEYQKTLQDAAVGMAKIRDPRKLLRLIVHIVSKKMKVKHVTILLHDEKTGVFSIEASRGEVKPSTLYASLSDRDVIVDWLQEKKQPLTMDEIERWTREGVGDVSKSVLSSDLDRIQEKMSMLNASVCVPSFYREDLLGILILGDKKSGDFFSQDDLGLFSALADEAAVALKNSQLYSEIDKRAKETEALYKREHRLFMHASVAFAAAIDARDAYTHGHSERVTNYSLAILDHLGPTEEVEDMQKFRQRLQIAAVLHDIGKIGISDSILHKPAKLTKKEVEEMERHPVLGAEIVAHIKGLRDILGGIRHHHERYDGKGYPDKLKSDNIPFIARIIAVADTYDAMTSDRPYRNGLSDEIAESEIKSNGSIQFDPYMVAAFLKAFETGKIRQSSRKTDDEVPATLGMVP